MNDSEIKQYWEENAEAWTALSRAGYDVYRDHVNAPAFLKMLPLVKGQKGMDIGCGEGHNTRLVAQQGAILTGIDISEAFIKQAISKETEHPLGIKYQVSSGQKMDFTEGSFDFCMATMSLMDMADPIKAIGEAYRVLKPGGFFQFSISHPCFATPKWKWLRDESGRKSALACGDYFLQPKDSIEKWIFGAAPDEEKKKYPLFKTPRFTLILSNWINFLIKAGFTIEELCEPYPDEETANKCPDVADASIVAYFLIIRCRKP
ncbi:MAG: methyltransferase [Candidatus Edwardsbacteria bacterium RIFOXYD12_FULL_50_11]|uniref:Methyltransferase n=1 Tax=Candidatus Edwardsbacteria bacterium GWF2_54_11 TaxID=1817851 RepID=A0A1F5R7Y5_9BACT|nr:MAG: methyltransferase [Candidatus Edwardsbacteria bacterium RifOxyC12_full_54_24]OGF07742.1 MAG: methyltransferase [Candidatus Edwardsbacteria bacterium RifOxyA12_full_54_48]OGF09992.1 MAG: methyltransferase [Candidatus Edwardsbacteria bacterium GWE2_54_12]OGF10539.1 MAG: methyltransferase [Candidatus Edwardsbacteria bacterium GWF2_54_11]OGF14902.1 MAG: methyltransferase [Candidatus Edwardsbacteria bacterium RIFOXYD12_FULL_50_11]OGJ19319.1 MAG: methyltransferase [Candidatus Edwardsbacteria